MAKRDPEVVVRAYDLGGFGDIAGAMRVASFLQRGGKVTQLKATSDSALKKMQILIPDTPFTRDSYGEGEPIQVDVAGHYMDGRVAKNNDVPHNYTEDMDHPNDRGKIVPIYLKSGMLPLAVTGGHIAPNLGKYAPMFYRPYREWDLPQPNERDVHQQILEAIKARKISAHLFKTNIGRVLDRTDKIGFAHISPMQPMGIFDHPYFQAVMKAQNVTDKKFGVGVFLNGQVEKEILANQQGLNWNVVGSDGSVSHYDPRKPTIFFLGAQPQMTTTGLFLASNMPNLVTGDLSLSDALYGLLAMEGPAFYYETAPWKVPTHHAIIQMLARRDHVLANAYQAASNRLIVAPNLDPNKREHAKKELENANAAAVATFADESFGKEYQEFMREALRAEILGRFGPAQVVGNQIEGFYIRPGAPYLIQDATAMVVDALRDNPDLLATTEETRRRIANGAPISINVGTGVLGSPLQKPSSPPIGDSLLESLWATYAKYDTILDTIPYKEKLDSPTKLEEIYLKKKTIFPQINYLGSLEEIITESSYLGKGEKSKKILEEYIDFKEPFYGKIPSYGELFN